MCNIYKQTAGGGAKPSIQLIYDPPQLAELIISQLQDESEERVRNITELEGAREQCTALRKESAALEDRQLKKLENYFF